MNNSALFYSIFGSPQGLLFAVAIGLLIGMGVGGMYLTIQFKQRLAIQKIPATKTVAALPRLFFIIFVLGVLLLIISLITLIYLSKSGFEQTWLSFIGVIVLLSFVVIAPAVVIATLSRKRASPKT